MMTNGDERGEGGNAPNLMTSYVNDPLRDLNHLIKASSNMSRDVTRIPCKARAENFSQAIFAITVISTS